MTNGDRIIIVVDDEPLIRMDLAETLRAAGFTVVESQDAAEALRIFDAAEHVIALVTDVQMPGAMNGVDLSWLIYRRLPNIALVVISGGPRPALADMPPATRFLGKPVSGTDLLREVFSAIDDSGSARGPVN